MGEPTWGEGHEQDTDSENHGRDELESKWEKPRSVLLAIAGTADVVGAVIDPRLSISTLILRKSECHLVPEGNHNSESDGQLLQANKRSSNFWRRNLERNSISPWSSIYGTFMGFIVSLTSALYMGTVILKEPTPIPVTNRPPRMYWSSPTIEQHWTMTPMQKIITFTRMVYFRDILSARTPE